MAEPARSKFNSGVISSILQAMYRSDFWIAVGVAIFFVLAPLQRTIAVGGSVWNAALITHVVLLSCLYVLLWCTHRRPTSYTVGIALIYSLLIVSAAAGGHPQYGISTEVVRLLTIVWLIPLVHVVAHYLGARRFAALVVMILALHAQWGVVQFVRQKEVGFTWLGETQLDPNQVGIAKFQATDTTKIIRSYGPYPHPNIFGGVMVMGILAIGFLMRPRFSRALVPILGALVLGCTLSFSRSAWIAAALALLILFRRLWKIQQPELMRKIVVVTGLIVLTCLPLILFRTSDGEDRALVERLTGWQIAREILFDSPWRGVGPGNYILALTDYAESHGISIEPWEYAPVHNSLFLLTVEWGLPLTLVMLVLVSYQLTISRVWYGALALLPVLLLDHYLVTQTAPIVMLITVLMVMALERSSPLASLRNS